MRDNYRMQGENELVASVRTRLARAGMIANGSGATDTFIFLLFLLPSAFADVATWVYMVNVAVFVCYMPLTFALATRWGNGRVAPLSAWVGKRAPTAKERDAALSIPNQQAAISAMFWVIAGFLFGGLNAVLSLTSDGSLLGPLIIFVTAMLGGVTTSAITYLLAERVMRPITTMALSATPPGAPVGPSVSGRVTTVWALATGAPLLMIVCVSLSGLFGDEIDAKVLAGGVLFLAAVAAGAGLLATTITARSLGESLAGMRGALARIEEGDFDVAVPVDDASEVGLVQTGLNRMAAGLAERERLQDLFGRHVGRDVARAALDGGVQLGGEIREVGVLFVDLVGSTQMASRLAPDRVVTLLNRFFKLVVEVTESHGGFVNKFEGDGALCVFGAPAGLHDPAGAALAAGRELCARLADELPDVDAGAGVSAGEAVAGNVGAVERFEYTVIGDPVNEAARLSELAKRRPERLIASGAAVERAAEAERDRWEVVDETQLRGRSEATRLAVTRQSVREPEMPPRSAPAV